MDEQIFVTRPFFPDRAVFDGYVDRIWESRWMTNGGPLLAEFRARLQEMLGTPEVCLTVNGHLALEIALTGLGLQGEVITTPFTFASTAHAISRAGLKPVFCDIREKDLTLDPEKLEALITPDTSAIMPVHVYGHPCRVEAIEAVAKKYGLKVIYDAAHAMGVKLGGRGICSYGDVSMLSFHATKLFNTIEGGALAYRDPAYTKRFEILKNFGIEDEETIDYIGGNAKMNEFQAAMGLANLGYMEEIVARRRQLTAQYRALLKDVPGVRFFTPDADPAVEYNYAYMPVLVDEAQYGLSRDALYNLLKQHGVYARRYFYPILTELGCYGHCTEEVPVAKKAGEQVLCLPIYFELTEEQISKVCGVIGDKN